MTREEAIKHIITYAYYADNIPMQVATALDMAISALKQQQEQMCATVKKAASAYASGDMKLFNDILCVKTVIIHKPYPFMSNRRFLRYLCETFPTSWHMGWGDLECKTYILSIPTVEQWRSPIDKPTLKNEMEAKEDGK